MRATTSRASTTLSSFPARMSSTAVATAACHWASSRPPGRRSTCPGDAGWLVRRELDGGGDGSDLEGRQPGVVAAPSDHHPGDHQGAAGGGVVGEGERAERHGPGARQVHLVAHHRVRHGGAPRLVGLVEAVRPVGPQLGEHPPRHQAVAAADPRVAAFRWQQVEQVGGQVARGRARRCVRPAARAGTARRRGGGRESSPDTLGLRPAPVASPRSAGRPPAWGGSGGGRGRCQDVPHACEPGQATPRGRGDVRRHRPPVRPDQRRDLRRTGPTVALGDRARRGRQARPAGARPGRRHRHVERAVRRGGRARGPVRLLGGHARGRQGPPARPALHRRRRDPAAVRRRRRSTP